MAALFVMVLGLTACQIKTNEKPPETKLNETFVSEDTRCLVSATKEISLFIQGKGNVEKVNQVWDCAINAVELFKKSTQGSSEDKFKPRELAAFFEKYFLSENEKINSVLLEEVFYIKRLFLGGNSDYISRAELDQLVRFIRLIKQSSIDLNPYISVYREEWILKEGPSEESVDFFNKSMIALQKVIENLGIFISNQNESYDLNRLPKLVVEMDRLFKWNWKWSQRLEQIMPIVTTTKRTLYGGQADLISSKEWSSIHSLIVKGLNIYLRYEYFIKDIDFIKPGASLKYLYQSVQDFIGYFSDIVKFKSTQEVTVDEAFELTKAYSILYTEINPSKNFYKEFFYIKSVFLGGDDQSIKSDELDQLVTTDIVFYNLYQKLILNIDIFTLKWKPSGNLDSDANQFTEAKKALIEVTEFLSQKTKHSFDLNRLKLFFVELENFYPKIQDIVSLTKILNTYKSLLFLLRDLTHSPDEQQNNVTVTNWKDFLEVTTNGYNIFLEYFYFLKDLDGANKIASSKKLIVDIFSYLQQILDKQKNKQISDKLILKHINAIAQLFPYFSKVKEESYFKAIPILLNQVLLDPKNRFSNLKPNVFDSRHLNYLQSLTLNYLNIQKVIEELYKEQQSYSSVDLRKYLLKQFPESFKDFLLVFSDNFPLRVQSSLIDFNVTKKANYNKDSASRANFGYFLTKILFNSIPNDYGRIQSYTGFNESEFTNIYFSLKPMLVDLEFVEQDDQDFARKRFYEAMLLTGEADGDFYVNFKETNDFVLTLLSGLKRQDSITKSLKDNCDIDNVVQRDCAIRSILKTLDVSLVKMDNYKRYLYNLNIRDQLRFINKHFEAAGDVNAANLIKVSVVEKMPHVAQYVETLLKRYDTDGNEILDTVEAMKSYPVLKEVLMKFSGQTSESRLRGLLSWLLTHDRPPENLIDKAAFFLWCLQSEDSWNVQADRYQLVNVLSIVGNYKN